MQNDNNNNNNYFSSPNPKGMSNSFRNTAMFGSTGTRKTSTSPPEISPAQFASSPMPRTASMPVQDLHRRLVLSNNGGSQTSLNQPPLVPKVAFTSVKHPRQQSRTPPGGQLEPLTRATKVDEEKIKIQEEKPKKIKEGSPRKLPPVSSTLAPNESGHKRKENASHKPHDKYAKRARVFVEDVNDKSNPFSFIETTKKNQENSEFVYLTPIDKDSAEHNPYNLKIVAHADIDPEDFFTMSSAGVTHFVNDVPEFTSLDQWIHEYYLFKKVIEIPLFNKYKMWKAYFTWRKNVRSRRMHSSQSVLSSNLFICNNNVRPSLLKLRDICNEISKLRLYKIDAGVTYTMEEFVDVQNAHRDFVQEKLENYFNQLKGVVMEACENSLLAHGFLADPDYASDDDSNDSPSQNNDSLNKKSGTSSYYLRDAISNTYSGAITNSNMNGNPLRYTQLAAKRTECRRLTNFIKLADYLLIHTLHTLTLNSVKDILKKLTPEGESPRESDKDDVKPKPQPSNIASMSGFHHDDHKKANPFLKIEVFLNKKSLGFQPNAEIFNEAMETIIAGFIECVTAVPKLIVHPDFKPYTQPTITEHYEYNDVGEGLDLSSIIDDDESYSVIASAIKETLNKVFKSAYDYSAIFDPYLKMYLDNSMLDLNLLRLDKNISLQYFRDAITEYKSQINQMKLMPTINTVGIILVDSNTLRDTLSPSPKHCLQEIQKLLPELAKIKNEELLSDLNTATRTLTSTPKVVEEFVEYLAFLQNSVDAQDELNSRYTAVIEMYTMMEEYQVSIPEEEYALYQTLKPVFDKLREVIAASESNKDEKLNKFIIQLESNISKLRSAILEVRTHAQHQMIANPQSDIYDVQEYLSHLFARIEELKTQAQNYCRYQDMFKVEVARFDDLQETYQDLNDKKLLWQSLSEWQQLREEWMNSPFESIDAEAINAKVNYYIKITFQLLRGLPTNPVVPKLRDMVDEFKVFLPVVLDLRNPALKPRHWEQIQEVIQQRIVRDKSFNLGMLLDLKVVDYKEEISTVSAAATNEALLEEMLKKVENTWEHQEFNVVQPREAKDFQEVMYIISGVEDIISMLEDSQVTITTIRASRHIGPFKSLVEHWDKQLSLFAETLDEWMICQRNWLYLESIFSAVDIQRQMPAEYKIFAGVDKSWKELMRKTKDNPNALKAATASGVLEMLQFNNSQLEKIQKSLEDYLETKRLAFPRFYFLSNDELLEILAQTKNAQAVQNHLKKCFDNISKLEFTPEPRSVDIVAMISAEGERVELGKNLKARGQVENWLGAVEAAMMSSLRKLTKQAVAEYDKKPRVDWIMDYPAQVVWTVSQIIWCRDVTMCLRSEDPKAALINMKAICVDQLNELAELVRGDLTPLKRGVLGALITVDVHNRDIVDGLISERVGADSDFGWTKQLRYYWKNDVDDCVVSQNNFAFAYGYEYLGCTTRLVLTPLTDRCYMTLTGALHLHLGGAPSGPAGTGKTETVKDLAKALAKQCVVFNCSEGLDYQMMGQFFSGLVQAGAWCCFDEFNRIDIEVLSVIAQQLLTIKTALSAKATRFVFEGREIKLNPSCGFFITMNPGYAGRTELPDNLKSLFRPVAMMIPDYTLIAEIILFSEGFKSASILSRKMVQLYKLSSEQLSQQHHYDFGMRAVKSVLVMAGALKRANPDLREDIVLIRSLRDSNIPKFLAEDIPLFQGILQDLFPGIAIPDPDYGKLQEAIPEALISMKLQPVPELITKVIQLYETMNVRHGVMLVGPTGCGKTTCYRALAGALSILKSKDSHDPTFQKVNTFLMNPKCISIGELFGEFNKITHEWTEGLVALIVRKCLADASPTHKWVIFDGPVDALWVENMNTVLDDNKMLCLNNGQRMRLNSSIHMVFEVEDLRVASPATVSRCGMVYIQSEVVGWRPPVLSWLQTLPEEVSTTLKDHLLGLFDRYVDNGLKLIRAKCRETMPSVDVNLVNSLCSLFGSIFSASNGVNFKDEEEDLKHIANLVFIFSYVWSLGGNIEAEFQEVFDSFCREQFESLVALPGAQTLYYYYVDIGDKILRKWSDIVPEFVYDPKQPYFQIIVPTVDTIRYSYLLDKLTSVDKPVLFVGGTGVGKTVIISDLLGKSEKKNIIPVTINFTAQTSSRRTQQIIEGKLEKKRKTLLGAPVGKKVVLFIDDVNMPQKDSYGAQPPIELMRQYLDFRGFYDRRKLFWKDIQDVTLVAACGPPGGGRNTMTPRFMRHFTMFSLPGPSDDSLQRIFGCIIKMFLEAGGFSEEIQVLGKKIVSASVELYNRICKDFLPTPSKVHYTFNLRDLSKVFQGILQVKRASVSSSTTLVRLWVHECMRVFHDRLVDDEDKNNFTQLIIELMRRHFDPAWTHKAVFEGGPIMFGDYMKMGGSGFDPLYEEIVDADKLSTILETYLEGYNLNSSTKEMKLIFFSDAIEHLSRISRIVRQPRGNALLVGVGGCGKRSLTKLAAHMADYTYFQIELSKQYGLGEFRDDLKKLYNIAGVQGNHVVFVLSDTQIVNEIFLEDINNILNSGEVPNLFEPDEYEKIINAVAPVAKTAGIPEQRDLIYNFFIRRVQEHLHIVLCMSPIGNNFRRRCRMFPSLVNCCTIDWFNEWPEDALKSVSSKFLQVVDLGSTEMREKISEMCVHVHQSVAVHSERFYQELRRKYYTTPTSYLELINLFISMLEKKRNEFEMTRDKLSKGLEQLKKTNEVVIEMQGKLSKLQPELEKKAIENEKLLEKIKQEQTTADAVKKVVLQEEAEVKKQTKEIEGLAEEAMRDLDEAMPALEASVKALNSLNKTDISEVKSFPKPPELVQYVMESVCILLNAPDVKWATSKIVLSDPKFLTRLINFDKDHIPEATLKKLRKYIENPMFDPNQVAKHSAAAKSICMWVRAIEMYSKVYKAVEPKRQRVAEAQALQEASQQKLREKQERLTEIEEKLQGLKRSYEKSIAEKSKLQETIQQTSMRLDRASKIASGLSEEQSRWAQTLATLDAQNGDIIGNTFIAAACVAYAGAFTSTYRNELYKMWISKAKEKMIAISNDLSVVSYLADPVQIRDWNIWGLPTDNLSIENAIFATNGRRWPLMIDPQGQANRWIKHMEMKNGLKVIKQTDPNFMRTLETAIRVGTPVLLEDVGETLDPALEPVLLRQTWRQGGRFMIRIGDIDIDYDKNFRLYITSKLSNPHYLPEVCIKVTIINFTVTVKGLEDQLLGEVVAKEKPEVEERRNDLIFRIAADKRQLKDIEDKILKVIYQAEGNILNDEVLINTLNEAKSTSGIISIRVQESEETEQKINALRESYRPVAARGSILYFCTADLSTIDSMYQYSLAYFSNMYNNVIDSTHKTNNLEKRLQSLTNNMTKAVFANVSRGLFEEHKLLYAFMICVQIMKQQGRITEDEWNLFLRGAVHATTVAKPVPLPENTPWLTNNMWKLIGAVERMLPNFEGLAADVVSKATAWKQLLTTEEPHKHTFHEPWGTNLTPFQKILLLKIFREEKLPFAVASFIEQSIGREFIEPPPFDLSSAFKDTNELIPLIFILSQGADPTPSVQRLAREKNWEERLHIISLGQGQGPLAAALIEKATKNGDWVFLQNCHLAASWMPSLEKIISTLPESEVHEDFRLLLSSMPTDQFPVSVLQNGVKVTNEPPKGLKANLARIFAEISDGMYEDSPAKPAWKKLLFGLCFFHAVIQERKKYGPLGWNVKYEFNQSDLEVAIETLRMYLQENNVPWDALRHLTGDINYGGRVTDEWDRRLLKSILNKFYCINILEDNHSLTASGIYTTPVEGSLQVLRQHIDKFPLVGKPEVCGLDDNADITYQTQESNKLLSHLLSIQPRVVGLEGGKTSDTEMVLALARKILETLPHNLGIEEAHDSLLVKDEQGRINSLTTVLMQETSRYNKLLNLIRSSLVELEKATKGLVVMSASLEKVFGSLLDNQVPDQWAHEAYSSLSPLSEWVKDLQDRIIFLRDWIINGQPACFWFSGFFFPQGFLTAVLQNHARKYNLPIDTLSFSFAVVSEPKDKLTSSPEDGAYIHGLYLEGARWNYEKGCLDDALPREMYSEFPVIHLTPKQNHTVDPRDYVCPIFRTHARAGSLTTTGHSTNYVLAAQLKCDRSPDYWILKAVALLCKPASSK